MFRWNRPWNQSTAGVSESVAAASPAANASLTCLARRRRRQPEREVESSRDDRLMAMLALADTGDAAIADRLGHPVAVDFHQYRPFQRHHAISSLLFFAAASVYEIVAGIA